MAKTDMKSVGITINWKKGLIYQKAMWNWGLVGLREIVILHNIR